MFLNKIYILLMQGDSFKQVGGMVDVVMHIISGVLVLFSSILKVT